MGAELVAHPDCSVQVEETLDGSENPWVMDPQCESKPTSVEGSASSVRVKKDDLLSISRNDKCGGLKVGVIGPGVRD